jgi:hypothetical protein
MGGHLYNTRLRRATSEVPFDARSAAPSIADNDFVPSSLPDEQSPTDRTAPVEEEAEEEKKAVERAVEARDGGEMNIQSGGSNVSTPANLHSVQRSVHNGRSVRRGRSHHTTIIEHNCTLNDCHHCCDCHIRHKHQRNYGKCVDRHGNPWPSCVCQAQCPPARCAQNECPSRLLPASVNNTRTLPQQPSQPIPSSITPPASPTSPASPVPPVNHSLDSEVPESPLQPLERRVSSRPSRPVLHFAHEHPTYLHRAAADQHQHNDSDSEASIDSDSSSNLHLPTVADIANHPPLYARVPYSLIPDFRLACEPTWKDYTEASLEGNNEAKAECIVKLLQLASRLLAKLPRGGATMWRSGRAERLMRSCMLQQHLGHSAPRHAFPPAAPQPASNEHHPHDRDAVDEAVIRQVSQQLNRGHLRMAAQAASATHTTADCTDPLVLQQLRELHPDSSDRPIPPLPLDTFTPLAVDEGAIGRLLQHCNNGKAGGPSGWNGAMLSVLAGSTVCRKGIARLIHDIIRGDIPYAVRHHLLATRLIALTKPNGKLRPIAMGEIFYRIAAIYAVRSVTTAARDLLQPHQFGIGVPAGCEFVVHSMQHALTDLSTGTPMAAIKVDIANAFNTCDRALLLDKLLATPELEGLHRLAYWAYSQPTLLLPQRRSIAQPLHTIQSQQGVRQGDPLSSLLFCLYLRKALSAIDKPTLRIFAYVDDVYIVGPVDDTLTAYTNLTNELSRIALEVNAAKSALIYFHSHTHPLSHTQQQQLDTLHLHTNDQYAELLGVIIGRDDDSIIAGLENSGAMTSAPLLNFLRRVQSPKLSVQQSMLLLAHSVMRFNYMLRCTPPNCAAHLAKQYDDWLMSAAMNVLQLTEREQTDAVRARLQAPLRHGGFGLSSAQHTAPIAFLASVAASAAQPGDHTLNIDTLPSTAQLHTWLSETLSSETVTLLLSGRHGRVLHRSPTTYLAHYHNQPANSSHLQQKLSKTATTTLFDAQLNQARSENDKATLALLQSTSSGHAWTWKQVLPTENAHRLNDEHYRVAARRDLGLPPVSGVMPDVCVACQAEITNSPYHGMQCRQTKRFATLRHNAVENALASAVRQSTAVAIQQADGLVPTNPGLKPDLLCLTSKGLLLSDVVVSDPLAPSNLSLSSSGALALADQMSNRKIKKYHPISDKLNCSHLPFSVETTGALSQTAQEFIQTVVWSARDYMSPWSPEEIKSHLIAVVAIAIQRGNGLALAAARDRELEALWSAQAA